jgi:hypothetical protein
MLVFLATFLPVILSEATDLFGQRDPSFRCASLRMTALLVAAMPLCATLVETSFPDP